MTGMTAQGLYLTPPHGEMIASGLKTAIAKARPMGLEGDWILLSGGHAYGHMTVGQPEPVGVEDFKARREEHGVSEKERLRWWPETSPLYLYPVEGFQPYPTGPVEVSLPPGVQTRVDTKKLGLPDIGRQDGEKSVEGHWHELQDGRQILITPGVSTPTTLVTKKSLTALILGTEETLDGPVAIYGLPITNTEQPTTEEDNP